MTGPVARARRLAGLCLLVLLPLAAVLGLGAVGTAPAGAVSAAGFSAGNIIADSVFFNSQTMSPAGVQAFLQAKEPTCASGYTCLRSYTQDTWTRPADAQCATYPGVPAEPASAIIWKTAQACGINPMVLLVLLQKESSLVTSTAPGSSAYLHATGYGCPDTAPCDSQYFGFYNQVYKAAWQYKRYTNNPTSYSYQAGRNNYVQYNPNTACGGSTVYIQSRATAALYIYTPYQPNAAALNNLYGTGDGCSAYGNRNFWRMFTDWFGSTQVSYSVVGPILAEYDAWGDGAGALGDAIGNQYPTAGGGWTQSFQHGRIHWSPATGARAVIGAISDEYDARGGEAGPLGYPVGAAYPTVGGGLTQPFQNGRIHSSPATGAHAVTGAISDEYDARGGEAGPLGYPTGDEYTTPWGWDQPFQNGRIHWSAATGAHAVTGAISDLYDSMVGEVGPLGYPLTDEYATPGGWDQPFQNGRIHFSFATGAHSVIGPISARYDAMLGEAGPLGYPVTERYATAGDGWTQGFQHGRIHWSAPTGAHAVVGALSTAYDARQGEAGSFGYPVDEQYAGTAGGQAQAFQHGTLVIGADSTVREVAGEIGAGYAALGGAAGALGEPTGAAAPYASTGSSQPFAHGRIVDGPTTGAHALLDAMASAYDSFGGPSGPLGWPVSEQSVAATGTTVQRFEHGVLVLGGTGAHTVLGDLAPAWTAAGGPDGPLGDPTAQGTTGGDPQQSFVGGYLLDSPVTGTHALVGDIAAAYTASGGSGGPLGYPVTDRYPTTGGGWTQGFQLGRIHSSPATGAHPVIGAISAEYDSVRGEAGPLGYPVTDRYPTAGGGWTQGFRFGRIHYSPATGAHAVIGSLSGAYDGVQGEAGPLGYPTADAVGTGSGAVSQSFQHGTITQNPGAAPVVRLG